MLAAHTGLRRGNLFNLRWDQIDLANRVLRIPRTKSGRTLSLLLNATALGILEQVSKGRAADCVYVFPHNSGPKKGEPVQDIKNGFHAAVELAEIPDFKWHDLRHTFASWLTMKGASFRSVGELLGHQSMKMTMRYAHLSPAFLSAEVSLLDPPQPVVAPSAPSQVDAPLDVKTASAVVGTIRAVDPENDPPSSPRGARGKKRGKAKVSANGATRNCLVLFVSFLRQR